MKIKHEVLGGKTEEIENIADNAPKSRLKLSDFYYKDKHTTGLNMPIMLPSGEDSGETLTIVGPESDIAIKSSRAFVLATRAMVDKYLDLHEKAVATEDFTEYNMETAEELHDLKCQFASSIVIGWSLEEEFNADNLSALMSQYRRLPDMVSAFHQNVNDNLTKK